MQVLHSMTLMWPDRKTYMISLPDDSNKSTGISSLSPNSTRQIKTQCKMDIFTMYYMYNIAFVFYGDLLIAAFAIIFIKQKLRDTQRMSVSVL